MLALIEDVNDQLNKDFSKKSGRNAVNIAFFDLSQMSGIQQAFYLVLMLSGLGGILYYFYNLLVEQPEKKLAEKQRLKEERRKKKK